MKFQSCTVGLLIALFVGLRTCSGQESNNGTDQVCYDAVGCFDTGYPWYIPILREVDPPASPEAVGTKVYSARGGEILIYPDVSLNGATFDSSNQTIFVIHGYGSNGNDTWVKNMSYALTNNTDANVLIIDWGPGASANYSQACGNTRIVGREISRLITTLDLTLDMVYVIGHSLGAHVASYIGSELNGKISRITGLDPAGPLFEDDDPKVRLDPTDAIFVDTLHTDSLLFGLVESVGHVDTYMNGGYNQPGCVSYVNLSTVAEVRSAQELADLPGQLINGVGCSHGRSHDYFIEAIYNSAAGDCKFVGHKSSVATVERSAVNNLSEGLFPRLIPIPCNSTNCIEVGLMTPDFFARGIFEVVTHGVPPFCVRESTEGLEKTD